MYIADIEWKERKFATVAEMVAACCASMADHATLRPMVSTNTRTTVTNKAGTVYQSNVHVEIDLVEIEKSLNAGERVVIAAYGIKDDGTPLLGAGTCFLWKEETHKAEVEKIESSLQNLLNNTGYSARVGNKTFTPKSHRAKPSAE